MTSSDELQAVLGESDSIRKTDTDYICPISHGVMNDPVRATDGKLYERKEFEALITRQNPKQLKSPLYRYICTR